MSKTSSPEKLFNFATYLMMLAERLEQLDARRAQRPRHLGAVHIQSRLEQPGAAHAAELLEAEPRGRTRFLVARRGAREAQRAQGVARRARGLRGRAAVGAQGAGDGGDGGGAHFTQRRRLARGEHREHLACLEGDLKVVRRAAVRAVRFQRGEGGLNIGTLRGALLLRRGVVLGVGAARGRVRPATAARAAARAAAYAAAAAGVREKRADEAAASGLRR